MLYPQHGQETHATQEEAGLAQAGLKGLDDSSPGTHEAGYARAYRGA
jgi:hypothetical protein